MPYGFIYKIGTTKSDEVYVGQTTRDINTRFKEHLKNSTEKARESVKLYEAMNTYGKETFYVEQLDVAQSRDELNEKEIYWIKKLNSIEKGFNTINGGSSENPMFNAEVKEKHHEKMMSDDVRNRISSSMHELRTTVGFTEEHKRKIRESRNKRLEERKKLGLNFYNHPETMTFRSVACYCILNNGERHDFESILDGGKWWYDNFHPFGDIYSEATYQRKIKKSIRGEEITFGNISHSNYKVITNIKWYKGK